MSAIRIITVLLRKWWHSNKRFVQLAPRHGGKQLSYS